MLRSSLSLRTAQASTLARAAHPLCVLRVLTPPVLPVTLEFSSLRLSVRSMSKLSPQIPLSKVENETYTVTGDIKIVEHFFDLPLDYVNPTAEKIRIFARSAIPREKAKTPEAESKLPVCVYLQGGPGFECGLPTDYGFTKAFWEKGYRMLFLDQRGTGLSTPLSPSSIDRAIVRGKKVETDEQKAEYIGFFRGDSIVRDAEEIRKLMLGAKEKEEDRKWTLFGQSYGGFLITTYLSFFPNSLKEVYITGGIPPLVLDPDLVYERTYEKLQERNALYYKKYPQDVSRVHKILSFLTKDGREGIPLPGEGTLTPERFLALGLGVGMHGGFDDLHQLVLRGSNDLDLFGEVSYKFLQSVRSHLSFDENIIYAILHESIYCQGKASNWSAQRLKRDPRFSWSTMSQKAEAEPVYFTGEMIYPSFFDVFTELISLKPVAEILAQKSDWPALYDEAQLAKNEVPVMAAVYMHDMYVSFDLTMQSIAKIKNVRPFVTNLLFHNAVSRKTEEVLPKLFELSQGVIE
ncbi:hypothetical protein JAAARDRAFT_32999 [Jaapia argillacea MUCL 33604]|uniref:AB hydrolase-1 domain-containing protein n=1 Tax=Jaapia argillacea MUCL 33604 TaxID=933084 RepID=A0A067QA51_9AGAM|nr:hypothetical protein JAAARDRAFT_32999 [Jaapia argillacea MUCL 33604]